MTAELLLNLVWLAIAAAAAVRLALWCRRTPASARRWAVIVATGCVVALLFPIISVTDDLSSDATITEETSAIRRAVAFCVTVAIAVVPIVIDVKPNLQLAFLTVDAVDAAVARPGFATVVSFRGPPAA